MSFVTDSDNQVLDSQSYRTDSLERDNQRISINYLLTVEDEGDDSHEETTLIEDSELNNEERRLQYVILRHFMARQKVT